MARPKIPEEAKKVSIHITVDPKIAEEAKKSGNASRWFEEAGKVLLEKGHRSPFKRAG